VIPLETHLDDADIVIALLDGSQVDDGTHGRSGIFSPENHPNRKLSASGLISAEQVRVKAP
jgi:nucleoside 2-deoxyribosyltransferase